MASLSPEQLSQFQRMAYGFAQATGCTVHIGARPFDKGWFANVDGIEFDGSDPLMALRQVIGAWKRRAENQAHETDHKLRELQRAITDVGAI